MVGIFDILLLLFWEVFFLKEGILLLNIFIVSKFGVFSLIIGGSFLWSFVICFISGGRFWGGWVWGWFRWLISCLVILIEFLRWFMDERKCLISDFIEFLVSFIDLSLVWMKLSGECDCWLDCGMFEIWSVDLMGGVDCRIKVYFFFLCNSLWYRDFEIGKNWKSENLW